MQTRRLPIERAAGHMGVGLIAHVEAQQIPERAVSIARRYVVAIRQHVIVTIVAFALLISPISGAAGQSGNQPLSATAGEAIAGNIIIGGLTAATTALLHGGDPLKAFAVGAIGGGVHLAGKYLAGEPGFGMGWVGLTVSGLGTSIVANAGRSVGPLEEISLPVFFARVRIRPHAVRKVALAVNGLEAAVAARTAAREGFSVKWEETMSSGAFVFDALGISFNGGHNRQGVTYASVAVIGFSDNTPATTRHEIVHVQQFWYVQETWGRPIEAAIRARIPFVRRIPTWFEFGIVGPSILILESSVNSRMGLLRLREAEAELLERCPGC